MLAIRIGVVILICSLLHGIIPRYFLPFSYVDFALILTVYLGLQRNIFPPVLTGSIFGLIQDLYTGSKLLGVSGFSNILIGYLLALISSRLCLDNGFIRLSILSISSIVNSFLFVFLHHFFAVAPEGMTTQRAIRVGLWQLLANFIGAFILFPIFDKLFREDPYDPKGQMDLHRRKKII